MEVKGTVGSFKEVKGTMGSLEVKGTMGSLQYIYHTTQYGAMN